MQVIPKIRGFCVSKRYIRPMDLIRRVTSGGQMKENPKESQSQDIRKNEPTEDKLVQSTPERRDMLDPFDHPFFRRFDLPMFRQFDFPFFRHFDQPNLFRKHFFENWPEHFSQSPSMSTDVIEEDGQYCIACDMPGVDKKDIKVALKGNILEISGERKEEKENDEGRTVRRRERYSGSFLRQLVLPDDVNKNMSGIKAKFENGVLHVTIPKMEPTSKEHVTIDVQ